MVALLALGLVVGAPALCAADTPPGDSEAESLDAPEPMLAAFHRLVDEDRSPAARDAAARELLDGDSPEAITKLLSRALSEKYDAKTWRPVLRALTLHDADPPEGLIEPLLTLSERVDSPLRPRLAAALGRLIDDALVERLVARVESRNGLDDDEPAENDRLSMGARQTAVLALGHDRTQTTAELLVTLTEPEQPGAIRDGAFTALETLTGVTHIGADAQQWRRWWSETQELSAEQWDRMIRDNLARRAERQRLDQQQLAGRVQELVRSQYRTTDAEQRGELLARLLEDPLDPVRELAMDLSMQRLVGDDTFDDALRAALRNRLDDRVPEIRRRAATLLRDLADGPAADRAARRVAEQREPAVAVLRAKLLLLTRLPRAPAIDAVTELLDHPALRAEAAAMLANAAEAGLVSTEQADRILERIRLQLGEGSPLPQVVRLLGRLGREADWTRIVNWLDSDEPPVKQAAAHVWAESKRSLVPLAERADDPHIGPVFLRAAAQRGRSAATLTALLEHRPDPENDETDRLERWQRALIGVAGRISPEAVLPAVDRLGELDHEPALRAAMLTAALDRFDQLEAALAAAESANNDNGPAVEAAAGDEDDQAIAHDPGDAENAQRADATSRRVPGGTVHRPRLIDPLEPHAAEPSIAVEIDDTGGADGLPGGHASFAGDPVRHRATLLLARGRVRIEAERFTRAVEDLERAAAKGEALDPEQRSLAIRELIRTHILSEDIDRAVELAREAVAEAFFEPDDAAAMVELLLDAAATELEAERVEPAEQIAEVVEALADVVGADDVNADAVDRLAQLEDRIGDRAAQQADEPEPSDDSPEAEADEPADAAETPDDA